MKYFFVLSCLLVTVYGIPPEIIEKVKERIAQYAGECKADVGASDDDIAPMKTHEAPSTKNGKCFIACINKKFGFQDQSGKLDNDAAYALIEKFKPFDEEMYGKMIKVADICVAEVPDASDECETAFNMLVCVHRENKVLGVQSFDI